MNTDIQLEDLGAEIFGEDFIQVNEFFRVDNNRSQLFVYADGHWTPTVTPEEENQICADIGMVERREFTTLNLSMLNGDNTELEDIINYIEMDDNPNDAFIAYAGTITGPNEEMSVTRSAYLLSSVHKFEGEEVEQYLSKLPAFVRSRLSGRLLYANIDDLVAASTRRTRNVETGGFDVEVVDVSPVTVRVQLLRAYSNWLEHKGVLAFGAACRESTSAVLNSIPGYTKYDTGEVEYHGNEAFKITVFVKNSYAMLLRVPAFKNFIKDMISQVN